jgi:hypothetical protein
MTFLDGVLIAIIWLGVICFIVRVFHLGRGEYYDIPKHRRRRKNRFTMD